MKTSRKKQQVTVMGGGPAGVFTAVGLCELGHDVHLISRPRPFAAWEGLSERPYQSLRHFGFTKTIATIGPKVIREAHWNGRSQKQNQEYILNRQLFDQALLLDAEHKGVHVIAGRVDGVERQDEGWDVTYTTEQHSHKITANFLVEARGREAKLSRKKITGDGDFVTAPATSALLKSYRVPRDQEALTAVASFARGWAWHVRDGQGTAILQLFISSEKGELPPKKQLNGLFDSLLQDIPEAVLWLKEAKAFTDQVSVRTAAANCTLPVGGDDFLVVGDGSLALDPLSGNGIFYAIGSGLAAAPVINTLLKKAENKDLALQFFQERVDLAFTAGCRMGREFYATEQRWTTQPFWNIRAHWPPGEEMSHPDPLSQPAVLCEKPVVKQGFIENEQVIVTADHPRGVWQLDNIPLIALLELLKRGHYDDTENADTLGVTVARVSTARKWLQARRLINSEKG